MKIYLDYIFLENLIINYVIIEELTIFVKSKVKIKSKIIVAIMISIYSTILYVYSNSVLGLNIIKIFVIIIAIYLLYKPEKLNKYLKLVVVYYLIYFLYVGSIISVTLFLKISLENIISKISVYTFCGIILNIFTKYAWKIFKSNIKSDDLIYIMYIGSQRIKSFVDTGNSVKDNISNLDVIFINCKYYNKLKEEGVLNKKIYINIKTLTGYENVDGYVVRNVSFYSNDKYVATVKRIIVSFTLQEMQNDEKYSALIGYNTYVEKLKGVTI